MGLTYPSNKICPRCGTGGYVWYLDNSEYVAKCTNCGHYFRRKDFPLCVLDEAPKPVTNADRIRAMSDEEMADLLTAVAKKSAEMLCKSIKTVEVDLTKCDFEILTKTHLLWLKSPVEVGDG